MASLQENLELLKSISANPKKQLDNYIAAGKKVVLCFLFDTKYHMHYIISF